MLLQYGNGALSKIHKGKAFFWLFFLLKRFCSLATKKAF